MELPRSRVALFSVIVQEAQQDRDAHQRELLSLLPRVKIIFLDIGYT